MFCRGTERQKCVSGAGISSPVGRNVSAGPDRNESGLYGAGIARNYAFIDSQNVHLAIRDLGWRLDWARFRRYLRDKYAVERAFLFIGYLAGNESLYTSLQQAGFVLVFKPTVEVRKGEVCCRQRQCRCRIGAARHDRVGQLRQSSDRLRRRGFSLFGGASPQAWKITEASSTESAKIFGSAACFSFRDGVYG
jgi:hypothetical protein